MTITSRRIKTWKKKLIRPKIGKSLSEPFTNHASPVCLALPTWRIDEISTKKKGPIEEKLNIYADGRTASDSIISYNLLLLIVNGCHIFFFYMRNLGITFASTHNSTIKAKLGEVRRKGQTSQQLWARDALRERKKSWNQLYTI
jgi:hypothetical protein